MRRYLLDSGIASDFIHRRNGVESRVGDAALRGHIVGICVPVLGELWAGVEVQRHPGPELRSNETCTYPTAGLAVRAEGAEIYGRLYAELRRKGTHHAAG